MCLLQKSHSLQIDPKSVGNLDFDIYFLIRFYHVLINQDLFADISNFHDSAEISGHQDMCIC